MSTPDLDALGRRDSWEGVRAVVAGIGVSGFAAADNLTHLGATSPCSTSPTAGDRGEKATLLEILGADGPARRRGDRDACPTTSTSSSPRPAWRPDAPAARRRRPRAASRSGARSSWPGGCATPSNPAPWLCVTGTNGKTTTVQMLDAILRSRRAAVGRLRQRRAADRRGGDGPRRRTTSSPSSCPASSCTTRRSMACESAAVLNVAEDHLDWYSVAWPTTPPTRAASTSASQRACVYNVADPVTEELVREADVVEGARAIGFTLGMPGGRHGRPGRGRARRPRVRRAARSTAPRSCARSPTSPRRPRTSSPTRWPPPRWPASHGVPPAAVRDGLRAFRPDGHRIAEVGDRRRGAPTSTTPRPPTRTPRRRRCRPTSTVVWVAGGLAKGATFDDLVARGARPAARASCCSAGTGR